MTDHRLRVIAGSSADAARVLAILDETSIRVVLPGGQPSLAHQLIGITLVDLLGRLFPRIEVVTSPEAVVDPSLPPGPPTLFERLEIARANGGLEGRATDDAPFTVNVGSIDGPSSLFVDGNGWQSYIGTQRSQLSFQPSRVPFGPLTAACRAATHTFAAAFDTLRAARAMPRSSYSTILGYRTSYEPIADEDMPSCAALDAVLVGAGSIGGAATYAFAHVPGLSGKLVLVDPQGLEERNPVRAILAHPDAAAVGAAKVDVAKEALAHHDGLTVVTRQMLISEYHASLDQEQVLPLVLCAVDSYESRRSIQDALPLEVINAACHPEEVTISRHVTDAGPCVCCLHMADVLDVVRKRSRLIADATGFPEMTVIMLWNARTPLQPVQLRGIERHRGLSVGALAAYEGQPLEHLWRQALLYGEALIQVEKTRVTVAAPFVTALAGFLLAAEAAKPADQHPGLKLGPGGVAIKYEECPYASPEFAHLSKPERWPTSECLCRSSRRIRLMKKRYGLA